VRQALPAAVYAVLVGVGIGTVTGVVLRRAEESRWTNPATVGISALLVPVVTYAIAVYFGGNGFVAAFLAGIAYRRARAGREGTPIPESEFSDVEALGTVAALIMWFVFGAVAVLVFQEGVPGTVILYSLLTLTVVRFVPVFVAMLGSPVPWWDRTLLGLAGPRGTTSIVFGLLAYNAIDEPDADLAFSTMTLVILGSLLLHGVGVPLLARWHHRAVAAAAPDGLTRPGTPEDPC
jgi:sodium/hydrogen antiporter